jgi:transposase
LTTLPKWTEDRTNQLADLVGDETPVSVETVASAAETLGTTSRSVASKLRKEGYEVQSAADKAAVKAYSDEQEAALTEFVTSNSGTYTYGEIAEAFEGGSFSPKSIQGKILSMELTSHVRPTPKVETVRTYTDAEEATFVSLASNGSSLEAIAERLGKAVNSVRGKALSLLRAGQIDAIPYQANKAAAKTDALDDLGDVADMTVQDIADKLGKTVRGVKTMLTRRGIKVADYDGATKKEKAAATAA